MQNELFQTTGISSGLVLESVGTDELGWALKWPRFQYIELYIDGHLVHMYVEGIQSDSKVVYVSKRESIKQEVIAFAIRHGYEYTLEEGILETKSQRFLVKMKNPAGHIVNVICRTGVGWDDECIKSWVSARYLELTDVEGIFKEGRFI